MPTYDGIYCVYVGTLQSDESVYLRKLIYIGKADREDGVSGRLSTHNKMSDFEKQAREGENIFFSCTPVENASGYSVSEGDILRVESALIYTQQPSLNSASTATFNYPATTVNVSGKNMYIKDCKKGNSTIYLK